MIPELERQSQATLFGARFVATAKGVGGTIRRSPLSAIIAVIMLAIVLVLVAVVPFLPTFDPYKQSLADSLLPPFVDPQHLFGTDPLGRDLLSRLAVATQVSLLIAGGAVVVSATIGLVVGLIAGYARGRVDAALMTIGDIQLSIPIVLLLIVLVATLGSSPFLLVLLLGITNWVGYGRVVRSMAVSLREREFVLANRTAGASAFWIIRKHLLPNVLPQVFILAAFEVGVVITIESSLSFIGLGVQPPTPSLGLMINEGQRYVQSDPTLTIVPALAIFLVIGGIQFLSQNVGARRMTRSH